MNTLVAKFTKQENEESMISSISFYRNEEKPTDEHGHYVTEISFNMTHSSWSFGIREVKEDIYLKWHDDERLATPEGTPVFVDQADYKKGTLVITGRPQQVLNHIFDLDYPGIDIVEQSQGAILPMLPNSLSAALKDLDDEDDLFALIEDSQQIKVPGYKHQNATIVTHGNRHISQQNGHTQETLTGDSDQVPLLVK